MNEQRIRFWSVRLNWLEGKIVELQLPEHATLVAQNLHQAWLDRDEIRLSQLWNVFIAGNPAFQS